MTVIYDRQGKTKGETTGGSYRCRLEGCPGIRLAVRWPTGRVTYPCTNGLVPFRGTLRVA